MGWVTVGNRRELNTFTIADRSISSTRSSDCDVLVIQWSYDSCALHRELTRSWRGVEVDNGQIVSGEGETGLANRVVLIEGVRGD